MSTALRLERPTAQEGFHGLVGRHPAMLALFDRIRRAAHESLPVLIVGETGTGKELVAQALHKLSGTRGSLVTLNVAVLSDHLAEAELFGTVRGAFTGAVDRPGLIEASSGGTLFLDEASELSLAIQARLLRALEYQTVRRVGARHEQQVRFRLLLSLQYPATELVARGVWRDDFCYRVNGIVLHMPPLRDRLEDVPHLVNHTLGRLGRAPIPTGELGGLYRHPWPGNVRELIRVVERAVFAAGDVPVTGWHLDVELEANTAGMPSPGSRVNQPSAERGYIEGVLREAGNTKAAALALDLTIHQLYRRFKALGIIPPRRR